MHSISVTMNHVTVGEKERRVITARAIFKYFSSRMFESNNSYKAPQEIDT